MILISTIQNAQEVVATCYIGVIWGYIGVYGCSTGDSHVKMTLIRDMEKKAECAFFFFFFFFQNIQLGSEVEGPRVS